MVKRPVFFYGWVMVAIILVSMVLIYGIRHSFAVFFPRILQEFPWSRGSIAVMFSLNILIYGFLAPVAGTLADRWKPRTMMLWGVVILGLATAGCAFANKLWHFYFLFGFLMPLGSAFSGWPIMAPSLVNWFTKRKGLVLGLGQMGGGLSFVYSIFVEFTISQMGWRYTFIILAVILVIFLLPLYFFFFYFRPEEKGLYSYGFDPAAPSPPSPAGGAVFRKPMILERTLSDVLRTPQLWLLVLSYALYWGVGCYLVLAHQVKFTGDAGYSSLFSVSIFALFGVAIFMGQLSGFLSDWLGREKTVTLATLLSLGALLALMSVRDTSQPWLLYVYSISLGYGAGLFSPTLFAASADIFHGRHYGAVAGLLLAGMGAGGAVGPWIGGYLFDLSGSYTNSFILSMVSIGLSCISLWLAAPRKAAMN